jgi:hypothetical protein
MLLRRLLRLLRRLLLLLFRGDDSGKVLSASS